MASPLEVLFLLGNLHAVGLMPDSDFQRIKPGLVELVRRSVYRESGAGEPEISLGQLSDDHLEAMEVPSFDEWSSRVGDKELWKHVISMFLVLKRDVDGSDVETSLADFLRPDDDIKLGSIADDFEEIFEGECLPVSPKTSNPRGLFNSLADQFFEGTMETSGAQLDALNRKVDALEREIADLRKRGTRSDFSDGHAVTKINLRNGEDGSAKESRIAELQRDLQRELRSAELHASKGETFNAGSARGRAARIESMLRALGA